MKVIPGIGEGPGLFWVLILASSLHLSFSMSMLNLWDANNSLKMFGPGSRYSRFFIPTTPVNHPVTQRKTNSPQKVIKAPVEIHEFGFESPRENSIEREYSVKPPKKIGKAPFLSREEPSEIEVTYRSGQYLTYTLKKSLKLTLEMWVPLGTQVTWIKRKDHLLYQGENVILDQFHHSIDQKMKRRVDDFPRKNQLKMRLHSRFFIECPQEKNQGQYSVEVKTPSGEMQEFNFFLIGIQDYRLENNGNEATNCSNEVYPRIVDFAKEIRGIKGSELFLPCRYSHREVGMTVDWSQRERVITDDNFAVTVNDELHIFNLTKSDEGWYKCTLQYNTEDGVDVYDSQITYVRVK